METVREDRQVDLTAHIGGRKKIWAVGWPGEVAVQLHHDEHVPRPKQKANSTQADARAAVAAALAAGPGWRALPFDDRAAVFLKAADLLRGPWRDTINAATMLGQRKTAYQAEIDAACELIDFWRFNVHFAEQILAEQPTANSRASGTAPTTGRSRVSSTRSRRSTSPPSPATCRRRRR